MNLLQFHAKRTILTGLLFFLSFQIVQAQDGAAIFREKCGTCHAMDKILSGPALRDVTSRGPWAEDRANLHKWINNPAAFIPTTQYTQDLQKQYGQIMPGFAGQLSDADIEAVINYIESAVPVRWLLFLHNIHLKQRIPGQTGRCRPCCARKEPAQVAGYFPCRQRVF